MENILKELLGVLPFILVCLISIVYNLPKKQRYAQVLLPIFALIYCIAAMIAADKISASILSFVYGLIDKYSFLSFLKGSVNLPYYITVIVNTAIVVGFMAIKTVLAPVLLAGGKLGKINDKLSSPWYYVSSRDKKHYVKSEKIGLRKIIMFMYIAALILSSLLFIAVHQLNSRNLFSAVFYPAFGVLILGEVCFFLNGSVEEKEKTEENGPEKEDEPDEISYRELVPIYKELFPERYNNDRFNVPMNPEEKAVEELLKSYQTEYFENGSQEAYLMYRYFGAAYERREQLDDGMLRQTRNLLDGKSVIFFTLFYEDTGKYIFVPVNRQLIRNKKILVILGREGTEENLKNWFEKGLEDLSNIGGIWKIDDLSDSDDDTSIALLQLKDLYNQKMLSENEKFLKETSMVFLMEPSRLLSTMQVGLSCVISRFSKEEKPQFIAFDRNCDGLVDSLSHVTGTSIEYVSATTVGTSMQSIMYWKADGGIMHDRIGLDSSRYLGMGTELAAVGINKGVSVVKWISAQKFPVIDMRWIVSQYYADLCEAMNLPVSQNELNTHFIFMQDMWALQKSENAFLIAEDEYNNAFETSRQFATRGETQTMVHVISQNYWLRRYMAENIDIFSTDPKAIPNFVADYQRSSANATYKILMRLISGRISEEEIVIMLEAVGEKVGSAYESLVRHINDYVYRSLDCSDAERKSIVDALRNSLVTNVEDSVNRNNFRYERKKVYSIQNKIVIDKFLSQLKVAYCIAEDEANKDLYIGSILFGHVYQKYLPGMMTSFNGKAYEILTITSGSGVLVRRASDHINSRKYYRQIREYDVTCKSPDKTVNAARVCQNQESEGGKTVRSVTFEYCDAERIRVKTKGYFEMRDYGDMRNAKRVEYSENVIPERTYINKSVIRIKIDNCSERVRFTVAALLNELFVTLFPDTYEYICASTVTDFAPADYEGYIPKLNAEDSDYIYIIEDSIIDLGLLINVDRYFERMLEIIYDVLSWHKEKLEKEQHEGENEGETDEKTEDEESDDGEEDDRETNGKKGFFRRIIEWFGNLFRTIFKKRGKKGKTPDPKPKPDDKDNTAESRSVPFGGTVIMRDDTDDVGGNDTEFIDYQDGQPEYKPEKYSESHYLLYGGDAISEYFDVDGTIECIEDCGHGEKFNYLTGIRKRINDRKQKYYNFEFEPGEHYCDFCGQKIDKKTGKKIGDDGREICKECIKTAITSVKEFKKLYKETKKEMCRIFGIKIKAKLKVRVVSAKEIAEQLGETFVPTPGYDGRTLGFARVGGNEIFLENGSPELETKKTIVHELTHIWQGENMMDVFDASKKKYTSEGMAVWTEVQYLLCIGEKEKAQDYKSMRLRSSDEYGLGLMLYLKKFPPSENGKCGKNTPFKFNRDPLK